MVTQISNNLYLLQDEPSKTAAYLEVTQRWKDEAHSTSSAENPSSNKKDFVKWGKNNDQPNLMHQLATDNDVKWELMNTRRDFIVGKGLGFGYLKKDGLQQIKEPLPTTHKNYAEIAEHAWEMRLSGYWINAAMQACYSGNVFSRLTMDSSGNRSLPLDFEDCFDIRYRSIQEKEITPGAFLLNPLFGKRGFKKDESIAIPTFNLKDPLLYPTAIYHGKHHLPGQPFYSFAAWWGTKSWTEVANQIPHYHISGLTNGYNIKYLIKIPDDYFDKEGLETEEERDDYKKKVMESMKKSLAGQSDRAIVTYYKHDLQEMKALPGVEIIPLKNEMTDDAYVKLYNTAKAAQASGHGVAASLAGVDTGSGLGTSGKEIEVTARFQQGFRTNSDRELLLRPMMIQQKINNWDREIQFWFEDIEVYTPDVTPKKAGINQNDKSEQDADK
jgi:hypothetical protein